MKNKLSLVFCFCVLSFSCAFGSVENCDIFRNKLFSISLPSDFKGTYEIETTNDRISVYDKDAKKAKFGGFAFGIKAYKNPADHANMPGGRKIGELMDNDGYIYDIVLKYPTDVQYDYTKSEEAPESYKKLYDYGEVVKINGVNGSRYMKNQGMKGEDLYQDILKKYQRGYREKWNAGGFESQNMSYMFHTVPYNKVGYTYYDLNGDGIEELLVGEIAKGQWKGVIYDIYTMVNRKPVHVVSGGSRNRYFACDYSFVCNEYSSGANESGVRVYNLEENSNNLFPQVSFKYDGYENPKNPYFISYSDDKWENVTKEKYNERKRVFERYERFDYKPLSKFIPDSSKKDDKLVDKYNREKDYFDYSVVLTEFPENYYYTTVKINKSKDRILIITDKVNSEYNAYRGLFYYFAFNGFVYPLGLVESKMPLAVSDNYIYTDDGGQDYKIYIPDKEMKIKKSKVKRIKEDISNIEFVTIKSADKFAGDFGSAAGDDVVKATVDGFYFEYHKHDYKKEYIENLMRECIDDGVKTQVQMYCQMVKKLHP